MTLTISSAFDSGNNRGVNKDGIYADLEIVNDHMSDY